MGVMPERIGKGPVLRKLDERYKLQGNREQALENLLTVYPNDDVADIGEKVAVLGPDEKTHLKEDWFGRNPHKKPWWGAQHVDHILKKGLIKALQEADPKENPNVHKPIKTLWICSGDGETGPFEVYVHSTEVQVTLIIFSPELPGGSYKDKPHFKPEKDIWVAKRIHNIAAKEGELDGPKPADDKDILNLGNDIQIVLRQPRTRPDPQP